MSSEINWVEGSPTEPGFYLFKTNGTDEYGVGEVRVLLDGNGRKEPSLYWTGSLRLIHIARYLNLEKFK